MLRILGTSAAFRPASNGGFVFVGRILYIDDYSSSYQIGTSCQYEKSFVKSGKLTVRTNKNKPNSLDSAGHDPGHI
jgi:hypothetical protein